MERISDLLFGIHGDANIKQRLSEASAISEWENVVGEVISENAKPVRIKAGILYVCVKSSSWSQELKGLEHTIVKKINEKLKKNTVKEIRFFQGAIRKEFSDDDESASYAAIIKKERDAIYLTDEQENVIEDVVGEIEDAELQAKIRSIVEKDMKLQKWREQTTNKRSGAS
jgi:hypothetical protein